jgi:Domain of unknown function (DUF1841)
VLYGRDRIDIREVFFRAWQDYRKQLPLEGIAKLIVAVAINHPEYRASLENREQYQDKDYTPEHGETNPFLHMGMHITLEEQIATDKPVGIQRLYQQIRQRLNDEHEAQHAMMDCLGDILWQAQQENKPPDEQVYLQCLQELLKKA